MAGTKKAPQQGKGKATAAASKAQAASKGGKAKKKKWSKTKVKEQAEKAVVYEQKLYAQVLKDVPTYKLITTAIVSDRMKISGSLARRTIRELEKAGKIQRVIKSSKQLIYTRAAGAAARAAGTERQRCADAAERPAGHRPSQASTRP